MPECAKPQSPTEIFLAFTQLALQGFGGVIAVAQREMCDRRRWLSEQEFLELFNSAQVLPGPNVCNLSLMIGDRFFGWRGAFAALAGMVTAPLTLLLVIAWLIGLAPAHSSAHSHVLGALHGIAAVAAGQIVGTVLKLSKPLQHHPLTWLGCWTLAALTFAMMALLHWPLLWVLLGVGGATCCLSYLVMKRCTP